MNHPPRIPTPARHHRGWTILTSAGSAQRFHDLDPNPDTGHQILVHQVKKPAVVFGSTQLPADFARIENFAPMENTERLDVEVCRRRSGGGLVIVRPGDVWIDAVVPAHSPLHADDVGLAFQWLGQVWLDALRSNLASDTDLHGLPLRLADPPAGRRAGDRPFFCFADIGHGEVVHGDRKIVGISQRRTRSWTRLQSLYVESWDAGEVDDLVAKAMALLSDHDRDRVQRGAHPHAAAEVRAGFAGNGRPITVDPHALVEAVVQRLPNVETPQ